VSYCALVQVVVSWDFDVVGLLCLEVDARLGLPDLYARKFSKPLAAYSWMPYPDIIRDKVIFCDRSNPHPH
jgi:hypothetical protein